MNDTHDNLLVDSDEDLNLQELWQETPPVNVKDLVKSVKSAQRRMRHYVYYEIASTVFGLFLFVWIFKERLFGDQWWIPAALCAICFSIQAWAFTWRRGLWNAFAKSPAELFQLKRRHLLLDIKIARSMYGGVLVGALIGGVVAYFDTGERTIELSDFVRGSLLTFVFFLLVFMIVSGVRMEINARRKLKELEKQITEYENVESL